MLLLVYAKFKDFPMLEHPLAPTFTRFRTPGIHNLRPHTWTPAGFSVPSVAAGLPAAWLRFPLQMRLCQPSLQATLFLRWTTPSIGNPPRKPHVSYLFLFSCRMHQKARFTNSSSICFSVHRLPIGKSNLFSVSIFFL